MMKRILASVLALALLLVLCPSVLAAGSAADLAGYYAMTKAYTDTEVTMDADDIENARQFGMDFWLDVSEKGTGLLKFIADTFRLTFDMDKMTYSINGDTYPFSVEGDVITLTVGELLCDFTRAEKPENFGIGEDAADDAVALFSGGAQYNAGLWRVPVLEPVEPITNCTNFTLCFRYDSIDASMLGEQRVYVCINLKNNAWVDCGRMTVSEEGVISRADITMSKPRNIEGIALLPITPMEANIRSSGWIENIR